MSFLIHHYFSAVDNYPDLMPLFCICQVFRCYIRTEEIVLNILIALVKKLFCEAEYDDLVLLYVAFLQQYVAKLQRLAIFLLCFCNSID